MRGFGDKPHTWSFPQPTSCYVHYINDISDCQKGITHNLTLNTISRMTGKMTAGAVKLTLLPLCMAQKPLSTLIIAP